MNLPRRDSAVPLYRSSHGQVACAEHAPLGDSTRWRVERWHRLSEAELGGAVVLECHPCAGQPGAAHQARQLPRKLLVLNVDDRPPSMYARERALRQLGFAVVNATTGGEALDMAERVMPSLVPLDVHLPDADGRDVCRQLKRDPSTADLPVILISSTLKGHTDNLDALRWGGADGYVIEPCEPETLASTIRSVITG